MSQVLYRKWRPQALADIAGQEHIVQTLKNALATSKLAHAYLFCGPRGTGKTSSARILAKAINCLENGGKGDACNKCTMCIAITEGRAMDLIEIDAASNRGIDEIRELREKVRYVPAEARYKVYVIDEVHMLTEPAFNALLKTLEEPPPRTLFVLATTEAHRIPATIISRCQRLDFRRISSNAVVTRLGQICMMEGVKANDTILRSIARSSGGSLRDACNVLEQLIAMYGNELTLEPVQAVLGQSTDLRARQLTSHLLKGSLAAGLKAVMKANEDGVDMRQLQREMVEYLRYVLLVKSGAEDAVDVSRETIAEIRTLAQSATMENVLRAIRLLSMPAMRLDSNPTLALELALAECATPAPQAQAAPAKPQAPAVAHEVAPRPEPARPAYSAPPATPRPMPAAGMVSMPRAASAPVPSPSSDLKDTFQAAAQAPDPVAPPQNDSEALERLRNNWRILIETCRGKGTHKLDALLRSAEANSIERECLTIGFYYPTQLEMIKKELDNPVSRKILEDAVLKVIGARYKVECMHKPRDKRPAPPSGHLVRSAISEFNARPINPPGQP